MSGYRVRADPRVPDDVPDISVVVPTLNEFDNIRELASRVFAACAEGGIAVEMVVVDDGSTDGTGEIVEEMGANLPIKLVRRPRKMGITSAILDGFGHARAAIVGGMDSDLSHPPELIPELVEPIRNDRADMTIASRYVEGGGVSNWPLRRRLISRTAGRLSGPLTDAKDPMSGFFFVRKDLLRDPLNRRGWKICLEILVKSRPQRVVEVPYTFANRASGSSKMGLGTMGGFVLNLMDLYAYRFFGSSLNSFLKFCTVGGIGVFLNLAILAILVEYVGLWYMAAAAITFFIVAVNNFFWNKIWTFRDRRREPGIVGVQLTKFIATGLVALGINLAVLNILVEILGLWYIVAQLFAIAIAVTANFGHTICKGVGVAQSLPLNDLDLLVLDGGSLYGFDDDGHQITGNN